MLNDLLRSYGVPLIFFFFFSQHGKIGETLKMFKPGRYYCKVTNNCSLDGNTCLNTEKYIKLILDVRISNYIVHKHLF